MKHFLNHELLAPNVLTVPVDMNIVREFEDLALSEDPGPDYYSLVPWQEISDMRWISAVSPSAFARFQSGFGRLGLADHVRDYLDLDRDVRFYTGFLHTRTLCKESNFHVDWRLANNEGFTALMPLLGYEQPQKLLYKKLTGEIAEYAYKPGEAIIFGDHFIHASPTGSFDPPFTLLVFNFGTDKMEHWPKLLRTQGYQCPLVQCPDGQFMKVDPWQGPTADQSPVAPITY